MKTLEKCEHNPSHTEVYDKTHTDASEQIFFSKNRVWRIFHCFYLKKKKLSNLELAGKMVTIKQEMSARSWFRLLF